jgi:hypothetical protein
MEKHPETQEGSNLESFKIDLTRLTPDQLDFLEKLKEEFKTPESISSGSIIFTPEEHQWLGSSDPMLYAYPQTPKALLLFPEMIDQINESRLKKGSLTARASIHTLEPDPKILFKKEGDQIIDYWPSLSLEPIIDTTEGVVGDPKLLKLSVYYDKGEDLVIEDEAELEKFKYSRSKFLDREIKRIQDYFEGGGIHESVKSNLESFIKYYKI